MISPPERAFPIFQRGDCREQLLASWRVKLRLYTNPQTGEAFTEAEIGAATGVGSRWWIEAEGLDLLLMEDQRKALYLADQVRIDRAATSWLHGYHGHLWGESPLVATGGSGTVTAYATLGSTFIGSTTVPDSAAHYATDPAGLRYQVLFTSTVTSGTTVTLTMAGIDTGTATNLAVGKKLKWASGPLGTIQDAVVATTFTGGGEPESDSDFADRLLDRIKYKPASGNSPHFRVWAREASNSVEDGFIYPCAHDVGSVHVAVTQKRGTTTGPLARIPNSSTLADVTSYIVPPSSPVVPATPAVVVTGVTSQPSDITLNLTMSKGSSSGWADVTPWPNVTSSSTNIVSNVFTLTTTTALPSGVTPQMMVWVQATSRFEKLNVLSVVSAGGNNYTVTLSSTPSVTTGIRVSPYTAKHTIIAEGIEAYFDSLGPGEIVDLTTDPRGYRAARFPSPTEEYPQRAGTNLLSTLFDYLGAALTDATLTETSPNVPSVPTEPIDGPKLLTLDQVFVFSL